MFDLLQKLLSGLVDSFKMKNPVVFTVVALFFGIGYFGLGEVASSTLPDGSYLLEENTRVLLNGIKNGFVVILGLLGAHTPRPKAPVSE